MLVVVTAATAVIEPGQLAALRPALLAAVTYSSNWWQALQHQSYFTQFGPPPPLQHLWSLAIEEQFYLVWPGLLIVLLSRCQRSGIRASAAWLCAALSALATVLTYLPGADPSRVYYGTDTSWYSRSAPTARSPPPSCISCWPSSGRTVSWSW